MDNVLLFVDLSDTNTMMDLSWWAVPSRSRRAIRLDVDPFCDWQSLGATAFSVCELSPVVHDGAFIRLLSFRFSVLLLVGFSQLLGRSPSFSAAR